MGELNRCLLTLPFVAWNSLQNLILVEPIYHLNKDM